MKREADEYLTVAQISAWLGVSLSSAYRLKRFVPWSRAPGVGLRFLRADVERYMEKCRQDPAAAARSNVRPIGTRIAKVPHDEVAPGLTEAELKRQAGF